MSDPNDTTIPFGYCHCGCGQKTNLAIRKNTLRGHIKGVPIRFISGHQGRLTTPAYIVEDRGYKTPCHIWQRHLDCNGYGRLRFNGKIVPAHRLFFEQKYGPIPPGFEPDHLCRVRACCNPDHIEQVTNAVNVQRGVNVKLTWADVDQIRAIGRSLELRDIGEMFGISATHVCRILLEKSWKPTDTLGASGRIEIQ